MRRIVLGLGGLALAGLLVFWIVTRPERVTTADLPDHTPDAANGALIYALGGCASCHGALGADGPDETRLAGGLRIESDFGTFVVPNISPDPEDGIGDWSMAEFVTAMTRGVSPAGRHYYPAFPYTSYARMPVSDVMDLKAHLDTLPPVSGRAPAHEVGFPFNIRRTLGIWKMLYLDASPVIATATDAATRGRLLVEGAGHCAECHTPRDGLGGPDLSAWLAGGPNPDGEGRIPNITPHARALGGWSESDIAYYLESGFTPDYDSVGGSMAAVVKNTSKIPAAWRADIAAYLKAVPAVAPD